MRQRQLLILSCVLILSACSSTQKRAEKYLGNGDYAQATDLFEELNRRNPKDTEIQVELKRAREGKIGQDLIRVRQLRLAGSREQALEQLLTVYKNITAWGVFPSSVVASTQSEETRYAIQTLDTEILTLLKEKRPTPAQIKFDRYGVFFRSENPKVFERIKAEIAREGKNSCDQLRKDISGDRLFYAKFVARHCAKWGVRIAIPAQVTKAAHKEMIHAADLTVQVQGLNPSYESVFRDELRKAVRKSPWFDPDGALTMKLKVTGQYSFVTTTSPETLTHSYTVSVPYTEEHTEKKQPEKKASGLDAAFSLMGAFSGSSRATTIDNGDGTVTIRETKYRDEPRTYAYKALAHEQKMAMISEIEATGPVLPLQLSHRDAFQQRLIEHHNNLPDIGLYPANPKLMLESEWVANQGAAIGKSVIDRTAEIWTEKACEPGGDHELENIHRCFSSLKDVKPPAHVEAWFQSALGISAQDARTID